MLLSLPARLIVAPAPLVTLDEAKKALAVDHSDDDTFVQGLIDSATAYLDGWNGILGRCILNQTWEMRARSWPNDCLHIPMVDVSGVVIQYFDASNVDQTLAASSYRVIEERSQTRIEWVAPFTAPGVYDRVDAFRMQVVAGYGASAAAAPFPLKTAILMMVATWYRQREALSADGSVETPFAVTALISPYRRPSL